MNSTALYRSGAAYVPVGIATLDGMHMPKLLFLVDTGATKTTIPKATLVKHLGYTDAWIQRNKVIVPYNEKPIMANGKRADVYRVPLTRINIGGHEIQHDNCILSSDTISLSFLLGLDILSYFKFYFDFDAIDNNAKYGRMFYEFRGSCRTDYTELGKPFAYQLEDSH